VNAQATNGVAEHEQGLASGLLNTSLQIGGAVVLAVVTAILSSSGTGQALPGQPLPGMTTAIEVIVAVTLAGVRTDPVPAAPPHEPTASGRRRRAIPQHPSSVSAHPH